MKRSIDQRNPFYDQPRFAFGFDLIPDGARVLDYGCFEARFGTTLLANKDVEYYGVDKNADVVQRLDRRLNVKVIQKDLPFEDSFFDVVTIFEVLEHIHDQDAVLRELHRVLRPGGLLLVSVPRKHVFSFLDTGNLKFVFPRLHRAYYTLRHSREAYLYRYLNNPNGLIGDIEKAKSWHQHFRDEDLTSLLERNRFSIVELDGSGLFGGLLEFTLLFAKPLRPLVPQRLRNWDSYTFGQRGLHCVARKT